MLTAYQEGRLAFLDGLTTAANPYDIRSSDGCDWENGWRDAEDDYVTPPERK